MTPDIKIFGIKRGGAEVGLPPHELIRPLEYIDGTPICEIWKTQHGNWRNHRFPTIESAEKRL